MVDFTECEEAATERDIEGLERRLGFPLPEGVRWLVTTANGGRPSPSVFRGAGGTTDVSTCLALRDREGSLWWTYELFVLQKRAAPASYLPFALDSGGNVFFVERESDEVFLLTHDPVFRLHDVGVTLARFWEHLSEA